MITTQTVFFLMVHHPSGAEIRTGHAYQKRETAQSWKSFVSKANRGLPVSVSACALRYVDGEMDEESKRLLSERYNMDPPASSPPPSGGRSEQDSPPE